MKDTAKYFGITLLVMYVTVWILRYLLLGFPFAIYKIYYIFLPYIDIFGFIGYLSSGNITMWDFLYFASLCYLVGNQIWLYVRTHLGYNSSLKEAQGLFIMNCFVVVFVSLLIFFEG